MPTTPSSAGRRSKRSTKDLHTQQISAVGPAPDAAEVAVDAPPGNAGSSRKRLLIRGSAILGFVAVGVGLGWWQYGWRSPPYYIVQSERPLAAPILTMEQYGQLSDQHERPFVFELRSGEGAVLMFGAEHTVDPANPQIKDIEERWKAFKPDVGLLEGRLGFAIAGVDSAIEAFGEPAMVYWLAHNEGADVYTWEQPPEVEVTHLLRDYSPKHTAAFLILRPYFSNYRHGPPANPEDFVEEFRAKRTQLPGLENTFASVGELNAFWDSEFPDGPAWQETSDQYGLPGYLAQIAARGNTIRDEHLAQAILELVANGKRVFVVAGSSHAVKLKPALQATLNQTQAP